MVDKAENHVFMPAERPKHLTRGLLRDQFAYGEYGKWYRECEPFEKAEIDRQIEHTDINKLEKLTGLKRWGLKK